MKSKTWALLAALIAVAVVAAGCGSDNTSSSLSGKVAGNPTDRAFVAQMVPHHRSAVEMAAVAKTAATSAFVKDLAANITRTQNAEISQMQRVDGELAKSGVKPGDLGMDSHAMGMDMSADMLKGAEPFDAKFIAMMVPHHDGAIAMAKVELAKGQNAELKTLAENIISAQEREVKAMNAHSKASGSGAGGTDMNSGHHSG
jgi:uncharacterized protein (DUF305 family)